MGRVRLASLASIVALAGLGGCAERSPDVAASASAASASAAAATSSIAAASASATARPEPPPPVGPLRVLVTGDLLPHRPALSAPDAIRDALAPLADLFGKADAVVANYEAATGDVDPNAFHMAYAVPAKWMAELPGAGIHHMTIANNHACDLGEPGLHATLDAAEANGIVAIGGDKHDAWTPRVVVERSGKRVCAVSWTTIVNANEGPCAHSNSLAVASVHGHGGKARIDRAIQRARAKCDATIAILHGGEEYRPQTTLVMDQAGHAAEAGADAVVIHHPHIASPVVVHTTRDGRNVPIFASVGNLVANQGESWKPPMFPVLRENRRLVCVNGWTRLGVVADLAFRFDTTPTRLDWSYHLTWLDNEHTERKNVPVPKITARLLDPEGDREIVERLSDDAVGPVALFEDACWTEKPDAKDDPRCHMSIAHGPTAPPAIAHNRR